MIPVRVTSSFTINPESVFTFSRNQRSRSTGIGVQIAPEYAQIAPSSDLPQASKARLHAQSSVLVTFVCASFFDREGTRSDERHVSLEYAQELR